MGTMTRDERITELSYTLQGNLNLNGYLVGEDRFNPEWRGVYYDLAKAAETIDYFDYGKKGETPAHIVHVSGKSTLRLPWASLKEVNTRGKFETLVHEVFHVMYYTMFDTGSDGRVMHATVRRMAGMMVGIFLNFRDFECLIKKWEKYKDDPECEGKFWDERRETAKGLHEEAHTKLFAAVNKYGDILDCASGVLFNKGQWEKVEKHLSDSKSQEEHRVLSTGVIKNFNFGGLMEEYKNRGWLTEKEFDEYDKFYKKRKKQASDPPLPEGR